MRWLTVFLAVVISTLGWPTKKPFPWQVEPDGSDEATSKSGVCKPGTCKNGGSCFLNGQIALCQCQDKYVGPYCQYVKEDLCNPNPCQHGGKCFSSGQSIKCVCTLGYMGAHCNTRKIKDLCEPNPCKNGGNCYSNNYEQICLCKGNHAGKFCEKEKDPCDPNPCQHGGKCFSSGKTIKCVCTPEYKDTYCNTRKIEEKEDACDSNPCQNGGKCSSSQGEFVCDCPSGYAGIYCQGRLAGENEGCYVSCENADKLKRSCCNYFVCWAQSKCWRSHCHKHPCREGQTWCSILKGADEKDIRVNLDLKLDLPMGPCTRIPGLKEAHELKRMMDEMIDLMNEIESTAGK